MAASIESIREQADIAETPQNKGLTCTLRITAYDTGMVTVNDRVINDPTDQTLGWVGAHEIVGCHLTHFYKQVQHRKTLAADI
jgi:hypothetical protein